MTSNSPRGKSFTFWKNWGSNIFPGKNVITILICDLFDQDQALLSQIQQSSIFGQYTWLL